MADSFHEFEHAGWQMVADSYQKHFGSLTSQTIEPLLDAVDCGKSTKLLDIATGPGYVAAAAKHCGADVLGIDFSSVMIEMARRMQADISFAEGDAEDLQYPDNSFDAATMNFGMLHMERPQMAMKEAYRVLKVGGKFAFSVWGLPEDALGFGLVLRAIAGNGDPSVPLPAGPPFFRFSVGAESTSEMAKAGFTAITVSKIAMRWKLATREDFFNAFYHGTPRTGGILRAQTENHLRNIKAAIFESLEAYYTNGHGLEVPMVALVVSGIRAT